MQLNVILIVISYFALHLTSSANVSPIHESIQLKDERKSKSNKIDNATALWHQGRKKKEVERKYIRGCFYTNWSQYRHGRAKFVPEDYIPGICTHIFFAFGWMNDNFTVRSFDEADLPNDWNGRGMYSRINNLKKLDYGLKTILSIGGWTFGSLPFQRMTSSAKHRNIFINSAINFVHIHDFDGIDIDWEYPETDEDRINFGLLCQEFKIAIEDDAKSRKHDRLLLSAAVASSEKVIKQAYNIPILARCLDFILLMSYDYNGAWNSFTGFNSPLYSTFESDDNWNVNWTANYWSGHGMPREKIIIGIPTYGRGWVLNNVTDHRVGAVGVASEPTKYLRESGIAAYFEICEWILNGAKCYWDRKSCVPYLVYNNMWFTYEDLESVATKMLWLKNENYGGAFVWALDLDDFNGKCDNKNSIKYPLISMMAHILANSDSHMITSTMLYSSQSPMQITTRQVRPFEPLPSMPTKDNRNSVNDNQLCFYRINGFYNYPGSRNYFILCADGDIFVMACPNGLFFDAHERYCKKDIGNSASSRPSFFSIFFQ